jgi:Transposase IS116/IS110/IS902 family
MSSSSGLEFLFSKRLGKRAYLTEPCQRLIEHACHLLDDPRTREAMRRFRDGWLGRVRIPKPIRMRLSTAFAAFMSTGDRTILGSISKRGNHCLRWLFVQAAWVVLVKIGPEGWACGVIRQLAAGTYGLGA